METYRLYEALEAGAVPIMVRSLRGDTLVENLSAWLPDLATTLYVRDWADAIDLMLRMRFTAEVRCCFTRNCGGLRHSAILLRQFVGL